MQRKSLTVKARAPYHERGERKPIAVRYWEPHIDPTPESLADDGRADGIAVRRWWQVERERLRELANIARMVQRI